MQCITADTYIYVVYCIYQSPATYFFSLQILKNSVCDGLFFRPGPGVEIIDIIVDTASITEEIKQNPKDARFHDTTDQESELKYQL